MVLGTFGYPQYWLRYNWPFFALAGTQHGVTHNPGTDVCTVIPSLQMAPNTRTSSTSIVYGVTPFNFERSDSFEAGAPGHYLHWLPKLTCNRLDLPFASRLRGLLDHSLVTKYWGHYFRYLATIYGLCGLVFSTLWFWFHHLLLLGGGAVMFDCLCALCFLLLHVDGTHFPPYSNMFSHTTLRHFTACPIHVMFFSDIYFPVCHDFSVLFQEWHACFSACCIFSPLKFRWIPTCFFILYVIRTYGIHNSAPHIASWWWDLTKWRGFYQSTGTPTQHQTARFTIPKTHLAQIKTNRG